MNNEVEIRFEPNPTQRAFITSQAPADYMSSRVREGKSAGLAWASYYFTLHNPGARGVAIRDTWENIRRTTLQEFWKWFPPGVMGTWNEDKHLWTWASGVGEGTLLWFGMDNPQDAGKLQSLELAYGLIDEAVPAEGLGGVPEMVFDLMLTRMNQPGMNWRTIKMASNNPDETHWTYLRFVDPGTPGFKLWQPIVPENEKNLPDGYYGELRKQLAHRPDLVRRFLDGKFGFQQVGRAVTPQFNEEIHLALGLYPIRGPELILCWDFGLNPTCLITQISPSGHWNVLEAFVGDGIGVEELIVETIKPVLAARYRGFRWRHVGDPAGNLREQSSSKRSAVRTLRAELGGTFRAGPSTIPERLEPLRAVLSRTIGGTGLVQVDRRRAKAVWSALRGGWHHKDNGQGVITPEPVKDAHSHPGDAMSYGAALLFPMGRLFTRGRIKPAQTATFFGGGRPPKEAPKNIGQGAWQG